LFDRAGGVTRGDQLAINSGFAVLSAVVGPGVPGFGLDWSLRGDADSLGKVGEYSR